MSNQHWYNTNLWAACLFVITISFCESCQNEYDSQTEGWQPFPPEVTAFPVLQENMKEWINGPWNYSKRIRLDSNSSIQYTYLGYLDSICPNLRLHFVERHMFFKKHGDSDTVSILYVVNDEGEVLDRWLDNVVSLQEIHSNERINSRIRSCDFFKIKSTL